MTRKRSRGAILIDVLVAAFVLAVGLAPLAGLFTQISREGQWQDNREQAVLLAQERMEQMHGQGSVDWAAERLAAENTSDFVEKSGVRFARSSRVDFRRDLDAAGHLMEAEVCVSWSEKGQNCSVVLLTYFAVDTGIENLH